MGFKLLNESNRYRVDLPLFIYRERPIEQTSYYIRVELSSGIVNEKFVNLRHAFAKSEENDHYNTTGHDIYIDSFNIVGREDQNFAGSIKETILMRVNDQSLNRNIGKHQLPHIWDEVLVNLPELMPK